MQTRELIDSLARTPLSQILILSAVLTVLRFLLFPFLINTKPHLRSGVYKVGRFFNEIFDSIIYAAIFIFLIIRPFAFQTFVIPSGSMWSTLLVGDYIGINKAVYRYSEPKVGDVIVFRPPVYAVPSKNLDADGNVKIDFIKRCVGVGGDTVELRDGVLYRNGQKVNETWTHLSTGSPDEQTFTEFTPEQVANFQKASFKLVKDKDQYIPLNYTEADANSPAPARPFGQQALPYFIMPKYYLEDPKEMDRLKKLPAEKLPAGHFLMFGDNRNNSADGRSWGIIDRNAIVGRAEFIWFPLPRIQKITNPFNK